MKILAIETSCDETGIALVEASGGLNAPRFKVLKNLVASQIKIHRPFGGVVPNLAKREHMRNLPILFRKIFNIRKSDFLNEVRLPKIDLVAVTVGPGLEPALWTGISFAKSLMNAQTSADKEKRGLARMKKLRRKQPRLIGVNHLEGHLYSFLLPPKTQNSNPKRQTSFPAIAIIVSGGHTILLKMDSLTKWRKLGETRDDAAGEAFDKVARLLKLPYPGGPEVEKLAKQGNPTAINFPRPMLNQKNYDFSFSGLKTAVLYCLRQMADGAGRTINDLPSAINHKLSADIAASFQQAAIDVLVHKTMRAALEFNAKSVILCGGVAANKALRQTLNVKCQMSGVKFFVPDFKYNLDNAAMIAAAGYMAHLRKKKRSSRSRCGEAGLLRAKGDLGI